MDKVIDKLSVMFVLIKYLTVLINTQLQNGVSSTSMVDVKQRLQDEGTGENESTNWKFTEVMEPVHCKSIRLTDPLPTAKASSLIYSRLKLLIFMFSQTIKYPTDMCKFLW